MGEEKRKRRTHIGKEYQAMHRTFGQWPVALRVLALGLIGLVALAGCGGSEEEESSGGSQTLPNWGFTMYTDPTYVDYRALGDGFSEAENLEATYATMAKSPPTFTGTTSADWAAALADQRMAVIPELEFDLATDMEAAAKTALNDYVSTDGKTLIVFAPNTNLMTLLNGVFSLSLTVGGGSSSTTTYNLDDTTASGTPFAGGPASLPWLSAVRTVDPASLPVGASAIYVGDDLDSSVAVAVIPQGSGQIVILGWDWYNAAPLGTKDGGWLDVLARASAP